MKHLLNNISEEEKNRIREQHEGGMNLAIDNFKKLVETKSGDAKPFIKEASEETCEACGGMMKEGECVEQCGSMKEEVNEQNDDDVMELIMSINAKLPDDIKSRMVIMKGLNKNKKASFFDDLMTLASKKEGISEELDEQDEPGYRINQELRITSNYSSNMGETRTIYVKTSPNVFRENGKIREGVRFSYFSYDKNDTKGYGEDQLDFGKRVQFSCGQNYVNLPPITGLNNHPEAAEKFAGKLSPQDNDWVQKYCKKK